MPPTDNVHKRYTLEQAIQGGCWYLWQDGKEKPEIYLLFQDAIEALGKEQAE